MGASKFAAFEVLKKHIIVEVLNGARAGAVGLVSTLELKMGYFGASRGEFISEFSTGYLRF